MLRKIRERFIKGAQPQLTELAFQEIPGWLEVQEEEIRRGLEEVTGSSRSVIMEEIAGIRAIAASLEGAEGAPGIHPKLESIVKKARPEFMRSVEQALAKPLPEEPDGFYAAATAVLKALITATRGRGRYLSSAYAEEMRKLRTALQVYGSEVNRLTERHAEARAKFQTTGEIREIYDEMVRVREEYGATRNRMEHLEEAVRERKGALAEVETSIAAHMKSPAYLSEMNATESLQALEEDLEKAHLDYRTTALAALHLIKKAEREFAKRGDTQSAAKVRDALAALAMVPDPAPQLHAALSEAIPHTLALVRSGAVTPKNRDEKRLFRDERVLIDEMAVLEERCSHLRDEVSRASVKVASLETAESLHGLERRKKDLLAEQESDLRALAGDERRLEEMEGAYQALTIRLPEKVSGLAGDGVKVAVTGISSISAP